jgi:rSAM/selenodomain-associated transferase 1
MPDATAVLVFAKAPIPGRVKTRIASVLGASGAARLYERVAVQCLETAIAARIGPVELWCAPETTHPWFAALATRYGLGLAPQQGQNLGERMHHALADALGRYGQAVLIGTDCPALTREDLAQAHAWLHGGLDAVFGPAEDGGYILVGLTRAEVALFQGIAWSTAEVMAATRDRLRSLGLRFAELPMRWDLDRPEDLDRLAADPRLNHLLEGCAGGLGEEGT